MVGYGTILAAVIPVFLLMVAGMGARYWGWLKQEADSSLMKVVMNLLYPALILSIILGNEALNSPGNLILPPLLGLGVVLMGYGIAGLVSRLILPARGAAQRTFAFTTGLQNYGYIPIPLIALLFASLPEGPRETLGVLMLFNVGTEIAFWTFGVILVSGAWRQLSIKRVLTPPVLALLFALAINTVGLTEHIPVAVTGVISLLAACAIPMGLLLTGATLMDLILEGNARSGWSTALGASLVRLGILPVLILLIALILPASDELRRVLVVQAAMPAGIFPIVVAKHFGGDVGVAVRVVLGTTLLSLLTIPLWIALGLKLTGLAP